MGIRESLLNTITSVADSDFVRVVTAAGASSKATVRNMFKGFESNLSAKSSLTDSDYIRVVGSDNEAYKQSVSAVKTALGIDELNSKSLSYRSTLSSSDDCDTLTQGVYTFTTSLPQNAPNGVQYGTLIVIEGTTSGGVYKFQLLSTSGRGLYYRRKQGTSSAGFTAWTKITGTQV